MAVYEQSGPQGARYWVVDFKWADPATSKARRIRRAAKDPKGRPAKSRTAAEQCEARIRDQLARGVFERDESAPDGSTLDGYFETYLADARVRLKPQTVAAKQKSFKNYITPALGHKLLAEVDASAIAGLVRNLHAKQLSGKTINNALSDLRTVLSHAVEHGALGALPAFKWQKAEPSKFDFFTFEEAAKLVEHASPWVVVALKTGMRIGELLELQWSDISLPRKQVTVSRSVWWETGGQRHVGAPKNNRTRTIPLNTSALEALGSLPLRTGYVFVDEAGLPLTPSACKWPLWSAQTAAGLRRTGPHVLRHTFASHLVMRGESLSTVQALMGHGTIAMTTKYAHLAPDHLASAVASLD